MFLTFKCPKCGNNELEVKAKIIQDIPVGIIESGRGDEYVPLDNLLYEDGAETIEVAIINYHCGNYHCGYVLVNGKGKVITSLGRWRDIEGLSEEK